MKKLCTSCHKIKYVKDFRKKKSTRDGYAPHCRECASTRQNQRYREIYHIKANKRNLKRFLDIKQKLFEYKAEQHCIVCDITEPVCLDFHHLNPKTKKFTISTGQNRSWSKILKEIKKCVVICKNCHAKVHAKIIDLESKLTRS